MSSSSKAWPTSRFTNVIRKVTTEAWGFALNSRLLRQICIGITEKHVREVYQPFNRFDDRSKDAHRNVVFAWQSGHRPLQRGSTYGLDGAFPTKMQPQLLDLYEWASLRWHEFLYLPSKLELRINARVYSDRQRILGYQPGITSRGTEETMTAERSISEIQLTLGQEQDRGRGINTPIVVPSSPASPDQASTPDAPESTLRRSLAQPIVSPSSTQSRCRGTVQQQQQSMPIRHDRPDDLSRHIEESRREQQEMVAFFQSIQQEDEEILNRESRRQQQEQVTQDELINHHTGSERRLKYPRHITEDAAPPPKRRRTLPPSLRGQDSRDHSCDYDAWSYRPLFGYPGDIATSSALEKRMAILDHLDSRVGFSDDKNLLRAKTKLWNLGKRLEEWGGVGCQLCYVRGDMCLDHNLDVCTAAGSEAAQRLLGWLETLRLDRFIRVRSNCSLCTETDQICEDIAIPLRVSAASTEEEKDRLKQTYLSATTSDGLCGNKPAIRRAIAALCAIDDQILGKTLTTFVSRQKDVDLTIESQAVEWFEQKIPQRETWVPQLLVAFDIVVAAFELIRHSPEQAGRRADQGHFSSSGPSKEQYSGFPSLLYQLPLVMTSSF